MKLRAILLIAILVGGFYTVIQSHNDYKEKKFAELLDSMNDHFVSLTFNKPSEVWTTEDELVVENLLEFLQDYNIQKLKPEETPISLKEDPFSLHLQAKYGNEITVMVEENLIIINSLFYYEIIDGPLDSDWVIQFFIRNQLPKR